MNESKKTIAFVAMAAVMSLAAVSSHFLNRPTNSGDFELLGQAFFPEFESASQAQSLEVAAIDADSAQLKRFSVRNQGGLWRIPTHYDYPAEAAARLATTASSVMGITRESLAGRLASEHERLGVIDPLSDEAEDPESVGKRITLKDASDEIVIDYIVGKEAGEVVLSATERPYGNQGNEKYYYVRRPDEAQTYKVKLDIDLSTKFSDWIEPDLLRLRPNDVTRLSIDNYTLQEDRSNPLAQTAALFKSQGDKLDLARASNTDSWKLEGLAEESEELQTSRITKILGVLDQMKIAGVRPKFKYKDQLLLTADLKLNQQPEFEKDPQGFGLAINRLQVELEQKGFNLAGSAEKMELVAVHGDMAVGTDKGILYTLHVGKALEGDETEIEIGSKNDSNDEPSELEPSESSSDENTEGDSEDGESKDGDAKDSEDDGKDEADSESDPKPEAKNKYLMVRVSFDESLILPKPLKPIEPVKPEAPEGYQPPADDQPKEGDSDDPAEGEESGDESDDSDAAEKPPADVKPERNPEFVKHDEAVKGYEQQMLEFEMGMSRFEDETKAYDKKVEEGKALVDELNQRFGDWYYVVSGDNLSTLQTKRADLVELKDPPKGDGSKPTTPRPNISFPGLPGADEGLKTEKEVDAPTGDLSKDDQPKAEKPKSEDKTESEPEDSAPKKPAPDKSEADKSDSQTEPEKGDSEKSEPEKAESK